MGLNEIITFSRPLLARGRPLLAEGRTVLARGRPLLARKRSAVFGWKIVVRKHRNEDHAALVFVYFSTGGTERLPAIQKTLAQGNGPHRDSGLGVAAKEQETGITQVLECPLNCTAREVGVAFCPLGG